MRVYMSAVAKRVFLLVVKLIGRFPTLLVHLLRVVYKTVILRNTLCLIRFGSVANSFIHSFIHSHIFLFSVLRQVHSLSQSGFSTECDLVLSFSVSSNLSFPSCHTVAAYFLFFIIPSLLSFFHLSSNNVCYKALPKQDETNQIGLLLCIANRIFIFFLTLRNTSSFLTRSIQLIFPNPSPTTHFKTFLVFLTYFPKCPSFRSYKN
jgi:hypothetical protein